MNPLATPSPITLDWLVDRFNLSLRGSGAGTIRGVGTLSQAGPEQLSFLANARYRNQLAATRAGAVVLRADTAAICPVPALITNDPYVAFAKIASLFQPKLAPPVGIHPSAVIAPSANIATSASIGAHCVIENDVEIGEGVILGPGCTIGPNCRIDAHTRLVARVTLVTCVTLGQRVLIHPGTVIGADGFGLAFDRDHWIKVPQLGGVRIGDDCEVGANCCIDRGALEDTILEEDVRLDNQVQIAHNVVIGAHTAMAGCSAVAGSAKIGRYCLIGGGAGIVGHICLTDHVTVTAMSLVTHSIHTPGEYSSGTPLQNNRQWRRNAARFKHLDEITRRLQALEKDF